MITSKLLNRKWQQRRRQTKRVDNAFLLLSDSGYATGPLPAITDYADTLKVMRASKSRDEKVPWK
jgi:hypothetical protein